MALNCFLLFFFLLVTNFASGTNYYVSNNGDDSSSGVNPSDAWKTLAKVNSFIPSPGDQILFKRGDEWVGTLVVKASGTLGKPIVYGAYGTGEKPKIYGSETITGWEHHSGNIYKASFPSTEINQVFVDDNRIKSARYPNSGYFNVTSVVSPTTFTSSQISSDIDYTGTTLIVRTREWAIATEPVIKSAGKTITLGSAPIYDLDVGEGFVLVDHLNFLDQPGEWYYDDNTGTLYLWTNSGASPESFTVRASTKEFNVKIDTKKHVIVQDLDLLYSNTDGIYINNSGYIEIKNNNIIMPDARGIIVDSDSSKYITINNNRIDGANHDGIRAHGTNHTISDNTVKNIRLFENFGVGGMGDPMGGRGISVEGGYSDIRYNRIENIGYNGIAFFEAPYTTIENNFIKNACLTTEDGAGIYCFNSDETHSGCEYSVIRGNIIDNVPGNGDGYTTDIRQGCGIYADDRIHNITIEDNTVTRCSYYGIFLHNNKYITVENNTIFDNGGGFRVSGDYNATGNTVLNNIVVNVAASNYSGENAMLSILNSSESAVVDIDKNTYVDRYRDKPFRDIKNHSFNTFLSWKLITGHDKNSTFINEKLVDEENEELFYNNTKQKISLNLGDLTFKDVYGNIVSGIITLPPYASIILVGKNTELINKSPIASNHTFNITSPIDKNSLVGKISAFDNDQNQDLFFSLIEGNDDNSFYININTGKIFTSKDINPAPEKTVELTIRVQDNAEFPLFTDTKAVIKITPGIDIEPPVITSFIVPSEHNSPTIPVSEFTVVDNGRITGFGITAQSYPPQEEEWLTAPPATFFFSEEGEQTFYAWAIDTAGNISTPKQANITLQFPDTLEIVNYVTICNGQSYNGWSSPGTYKQLRTLNADSVQLTITELTIDSAEYITENITIKEGESYFGRTKPGIYERKLKNINGCDSIVETKLTVLQPIYSSEEITICEGENYLDWDSTGQYTRTLPSVLGADSIVTTYLHVNPIYQHEKNVYLTKGESYNGWTESGSYIQQYTSITGCDSIVTINLTVHPWPGDAKYSYQEWSEEKKYRRNGTSASTNPVEVQRLKSITKHTSGLKIYPNPTDSYIIINSPSSADSSTRILLFNSTGKIFHAWQMETGSKKIDLSHIPSGIYYIMITNMQTQSVEKIIKN